MHLIHSMVMWKYIVALNFLFLLGLAKGDKFILKFPNGTMIQDELKELNGLIDREESLRSYFMEPVIQTRLHAAFDRLSSEVPRFHELAIPERKLSSAEEKEFEILLDEVVRKYYKNILRDALALGDIEFILVDEGGVVKLEDKADTDKIKNILALLVNTLKMKHKL